MSITKNLIKTFLISFSAFGFIIGVLPGIFGGLYIGILVGTFSGVSFALFTTVFVYIQTKRFRKTEKTIDQNIILEGGANHFKGKEAVGGWLYLTQNELVFKSHAFNVQTHQMTISLNNIIQAKSRLTAGLIPNGLQIELKDGTVEKFVVHNGKNWVQSITKTISLIPKK